MNTMTVIMHAKLWRILLLCGCILLAAAPAAHAAGPPTHIVSAGETLTAIAARYGVALSDLVALNHLGRSGHVFGGQTLQIPLIPPATDSAPASVRLSGVPLLRQRQSLTCEEAAAAMASRGEFSEARLVRAMQRSPNPFLGIRGRTNAPVFGSLSDYGTYAQAVQAGLDRLGHPSTVLYGQSYAAFLARIEAALQAGQPVVWWTTFRQMRESPVNISLADGTRVRMVRYEHAVTIVGETSTGFIYNDPYNATVRSVSFANHQRVSAYFNNMALLLDN